MTYVVSEVADTAEKQILVTADRTLVDKIISEWVEDQVGDSLKAPALKQAK